jgi:hypothetical protein
MTSNTRLVVAVGMITALVLGIVAWWLTRPAAPPSAEGDGWGAIRRPSTPVTIRGDILGPIRPGSMVPLNLSFENPNDFDLALDQVTVKVMTVTAPRADATHACTVADFEIRQPAPGVELKLEGKRTQDLRGMGVQSSQWPAVGMIDRPVNQDGCKGARLRLRYEAKGLEVHR